MRMLIETEGAYRDGDEVPVIRALTMVGYEPTVTVLEDLPYITIDNREAQVFGEPLAVFPALKPVSRCMILEDGVYELLRKDRM